jgi:hypothetical protein
MADLLRCPQCRAVLASQHLETFAPCGSCGTAVQAFVFPAWFKELAPSRPAEALINAGEAACFYHPGKQAVVPCDACGRFLCALCDCELQGEHFCPACVSVSRGKGRLAHLESRRTTYDSMALLLAIGSFFTGPLALVLGPAAIFVALWYWKKPSSLVRKSTGRNILAIVIAVLSMALWTILLLMD